MMSQKTKQLWDISKEREREFLTTMVEPMEETMELFKMIRNAEFRRGKEEALNNFDEELKKKYQKGYKDGEKQAIAENSKLPLKAIKGLINGNYTILENIHSPQTKPVMTKENSDIGECEVKYKPLTRDKTEDTHSQICKTSNSFNGIRLCIKCKRPMGNSWLTKDGFYMHRHCQNEAFEPMEERPQ
jgi:hypothetical protein